MKNKKKKKAIILLNKEQKRERNRLYMRVYRSKKKISKLSVEKKKGYRDKIKRERISLKENKLNLRHFNKTLIIDTELIKKVPKNKEYRYNGILLSESFINKINLLRDDLIRDGYRYTKKKLISMVYYHIRYMVLDVRNKEIKYSLDRSFTSYVSNYFYIFDDYYYLNSGHEIVENFVNDNGVWGCILLLRDVLGNVYRFKNYLNYNDAISRMYSVVWYGADDYYKENVMDSPILYVPVTYEIETKVILIDFNNAMVSNANIKDWGDEYFKNRNDAWRKRTKLG